MNAGIARLLLALATEQIHNALGANAEPPSKGERSSDLVIELVYYLSSLERTYIECDEDDHESDIAPVMRGHDVEHVEQPVVGLLH